MPEVEIHRVQITAPPGCEAAARVLLRRFYTQDPWGNRIQFLVALG